MTESGYRCLLCPEDDAYEDSKEVNVKRHVTTLDDKRHKDRKGNEPGVYEEFGNPDVEEPGKSDDPNRVRETSGNASYSGPSTGLDMTMQHLAELADDDDEEVTVDDVEEAAEKLPRDVTLVALRDGEILDVMSADSVERATKLTILDQLKGSCPSQ